MEDAAQFYNELDEMFANHASADAIETYLLRKLTEANPLQLSILNELMGFYRSRGEHTKKSVNHQSRSKSCKQNAISWHRSWHNYAN